MSDSFYIKTYLVLAILFLLGGIGLFWFAPKKGDSKQLKIKYWVYLLVLLTHILLLQFYVDGFRILSILVLLIGFYEVLKLFLFSNVNNRKIGIISEVFYLLVCWCYFHFILMDQAILLFVYLIVVSFDGFCQLTGELLGKNKMLKRISPGKTWEGLAGGIIGTLFIFLLIRKDFDPIIKNLFATWLLIIAFAFVGDVVASLLKRSTGIKDFSRLIPGHGGVIDRFDSLLMAGSATYISNLIVQI